MDSVELEKTIIQHGLKLEKINTTTINIEKCLDRMYRHTEKCEEFRIKCREENNKKYVTAKIFYSITATVIAALSYLFTTNP